MAVLLGRTVPFFVRKAVLCLRKNKLSYRNSQKHLGRYISSQTKRETENALISSTSRTKASLNEGQH